MIRTGNEYRDSLRDGRQVWIDGEKVKDVTEHRAFKPIVDIRARIYDMAHEAEFQDTMSYADGDERNCVAHALPKSRADWHAKRDMVGAVMNEIGGVVIRVGDSRR